MAKQRGNLESCSEERSDDMTDCEADRINQDFPSRSNLSRKEQSSTRFILSDYLNAQACRVKSIAPRDYFLAITQTI
jgi:hypothetical protein